MNVVMDSKVFESDLSSRGLNKFYPTRHEDSSNKINENPVEVQATLEELLRAGDPNLKKAPVNSQVLNNIKLNNFIQNHLSDTDSQVSRPHSVQQHIFS